MGDIRNAQVGEPEPVSATSLPNIKRLIDMEVELSDVGWDTEPARLFAIDTALLALRRSATQLSELERQALVGILQEARRLAINGRDGELGYLQNDLEPFLAQSTSRWVWLTALNALLPSPFRAAETAVQAVLLEDPDGRDDIGEVLRQRLRARLGEGTLMFEEASDLIATA